MPITIKSNVMKFKNDQGEYVGINAVGGSGGGGDTQQTLADLNLAIVDGQLCYVHEEEGDTQDESDN